MRWVSCGIVLVPTRKPAFAADVSTPIMATEKPLDRPGTALGHLAVEAILETPHCPLLRRLPVGAHSVEGLLHLVEGEQRKRLALMHLDR